ncbi:hypothetical protein Lepto7375DRAFT_3272 [Leptolyngbya sp. PCC 7375]|nr:hypothetical protein Lepto7375DRAFT_3272 [Leptolyngbya sp. PCC 7375]
MTRSNLTQSNRYVSPRRPAPQRRPTGYHVKPRSPRSRTSQRPNWLFGSIALAALALMPQDIWSRISMPISEQTAQSQSVQPWHINRTKAAQTCEAVLNADQRLSRNQLTQFLSIAQDSSQATVHETISRPYCTLSKAHQRKQSEAYPLEFDPETWFVVNYEQGIYKSYDFVFKK